jgi:hypothetical protein
MTRQLFSVGRCPLMGDPESLHSIIRRRVWETLPF